MRLLAIGAHPDDVEYGCAGTLIKHAQKGDKVYLLILTHGEMGGDPQVRKREQEEAARLLGAEKIFWGPFKDTKLPVIKEIINFLEKVIEKVKPDEVYVNYSDDTHQDHRVLACCAATATRYIKRVIYYEDYTSANFEPNLFVDIGDVLERKIEIMKAHHSQVSKSYPTGLDTLESVRAIANFRGFQGKVKQAEGFIPLRYMKEI